MFKNCVCDFDKTCLAFQRDDSSCSENNSDVLMNINRRTVSRATNAIMHCGLTSPYQDFIHFVIFFNYQKTICVSCKKDLTKNLYDVLMIVPQAKQLLCISMSIKHVQRHSLGSRGNVTTQ